MAVYKAITFEGGSLTGTNGFTVASSRASLHTERPLSGTYSCLMDVNADFGGFNQYEIPSGNRGAIYAAWYMRFYYIPFGSPTNIAELVANTGTGRGTHGYIGIDINGYIRFYEGTGTTPTGDAYGPIIPGEIYRFEWSWVANTGERTLAIAVEDGPATTILDESGLTLPSPVQFNIGAPNTSANDHIVFTMDELLFDDSEIPALGPLNDPAYTGFVGHIGSDATMRRDTQQAYVTLGYRVEWTHDNDYLTYDPSRYDFTVFHYPTQENMATTGPWLRGLVDAGYPVLVGTNWTNIGNFQNLASLPAQMRLTGNAEGRIPATFYGGGDEITIVDNTHPITEQWTTGALTVYETTGHWVAYIPPAPHAGTLLAIADPGSTTAGGINTWHSAIAVEQGDLDLDAAPVGARVVVAGWMYGNLPVNQRPYQSGYAATGLALMEAVAQWLMASPVPEPEPIDIEAVGTLRLDGLAMPVVERNLEAVGTIVLDGDAQPRVIRPVEIDAVGTIVLDGDADLVTKAPVEIGAVGTIVLDGEAALIHERPSVLLTAVGTLVLDGEAASNVTRLLETVGTLYIDGDEGYVGPGTGIVVGERPTDIIGKRRARQQAINRLREGDWSPLMLPWAELDEIAGRGVVLARTASDEREDQQIEWQVIPNSDPGVTAALRMGEALRYRPPERDDLAREVVRQRAERERIRRE